MIFREFPALGREVSLLGMGCAPLLSRAGRRASVKAIGLALESGINFFDTADSYGHGESEKTLGELLRPHRREVVIATKVGLAYSGAVRRLTWLKPLVRPLVRRFKAVRRTVSSVAGAHASGDYFSTGHLTRSLEGSLERLGVEAIDLYLLHNPSVEVLRRGEAVEFLERARQRGTIRAYGVSCGGVAEARAALEFPGVSALQLEINWLDTSAIDTILPVAAERGIAVIARAPFANGRVFDERFTPPGIPPQRLEGTDRRHVIAREALAFVARLPAVTVVLPSMVGAGHIRENVAHIGHASASAMTGIGLEASNANESRAK